MPLHFFSTLTQKARFWLGLLLAAACAILGSGENAPYARELKQSIKHSAAILEKYTPQSDPP